MIRIGFMLMFLGMSLMDSRYIAIPVSITIAGIILIIVGSNERRSNEYRDSRRSCGNQ